MAKDECPEKRDCSRCQAGMGGGFYALAVIGAAVYYIANASGFWSIILAILKAIVWPAFVVYKAFTLLGM